MSTTPAPRTVADRTGLALSDAEFAALVGIEERDVPRFLDLCRRAVTAESLWARVHGTTATGLWARVHGYPPSPFRRTARRAHAESLRARVEAFRSRTEADR